MTGGVISANLLVRGPSTQVALPHSANQIKAVAGQDQPLFYVAEKALWTIDGRLALSNVDLAAVNAHGQILILNGWREPVHVPQVLLTCPFYRERALHSL